MKVFLSHSSIDKPFVEQLNKDLKNEGIETWFDKNDIRIGDVLSDVITQGITESSFFLMVLSQNSINSKWMKNEFDEGYDQYVTSKKTILPVLYGNIEFDDIPQRLKKHLCADFRNNDDYDNAFSKLLKAIKKQPKKKKKKKKKKEGATISKEEKTSSSSDLEILLAENKTKEVLKQLLSFFSKNKEESLHSNAILQLSRLARIEESNRIGRISQDNYNVEKAKIDSSVLYLIKKTK